MQLKKKPHTLQTLLTCSLVFQGTLPAKPQRGGGVILSGDIKKTSGLSPGLNEV